MVHAAPGDLMPTPPPNRVTDLLRAWSAGESAALEELLPLVYGELHRMAARAMERQPEGHTLQTTALVNEAYLRLVGPEGESNGTDWQSRGHFFGVAARAMRSILVDHARARQAIKRGGRAAPPLTLTDADVPTGSAERELDLIALDEALGRLATFDERKARLVELRYFTGLELQDAAAMLEISPATAKREWSAARAWLRRALTPGPGTR
jgi:RNA polymerase sigma-70 factor, ECF subfamily